MLAALLLIACFVEVTLSSKPAVSEAVSFVSSQFSFELSRGKHGLESSKYSEAYLRKHTRYHLNAKSQV